MDTRWRSHPFLAGMSRAQLALLTDCAMAVHSKRDKPFYAKASSLIDFTWLRAAKSCSNPATGFNEPMVVEIDWPGGLARMVMDVSAIRLAFTARAVEPTTAIFFYGTILREYCEKDHSLGYELFKRMVS